MIVAIVLGIIIATPKHEPTNNEATSTFAKGVSLSPKSYSSADFTDFFVKAKQAGSIVSWAGDWNDLNTPNGAATVVASLLRRTDMRQSLNFNSLTNQAALY